ncbi:unnamed protein product [Effrenium voratum]|nr:unnamed protein product [Effrenium voratum]
MKRKIAPTSCQALGDAGPEANGRFQPGFVPRKMCTWMESQGFCQRGNDCSFAHSFEELGAVVGGGRPHDAEGWASAGEMLAPQGPASPQGRSFPGFAPWKMCTWMESTGFCQKGDACSFAHSAAELTPREVEVKMEQQETGAGRFRPGFVPRKMCTYMETKGFCQKGASCTFAHSAEELLADAGNAGPPADLPVEAQDDLAAFQEAVKQEAGPGRFRPGFVPRKMCTYMETKGYCQKGENCTFAHSAEELFGDSGNDGPPADLPVEAQDDLAAFQESFKQEAGPGRFRPGFVPRKMCTYMETKGYCQKGENCTFAHSAEELFGDSGNDGAPVDFPAEAQDELAAVEEAIAQAGPQRFPFGFVPRRMCNFMETQGYCAKGDNCTFAHSAEELLADGGNGGIDAGIADTFEVRTLRTPHSEASNQPAGAGPRSFENNFKPACLCKMWVQHPSMCNRGVDCTFAHGLAEMSGELGVHLQKLFATGLLGRLREERAPAPALALALHSGKGGLAKGGFAGGGKAGPMGPMGPMGAMGGMGGMGGMGAMGAMGAMGDQGKGKGKGLNLFATRSFERQPVRMCTYWLQSPEKCLKGDVCTFAHGIHELTPESAAGCPVSRFLHTGFTPTALCKNLTFQGECLKGAKCTFAHSPEEMM